MKRLRKAYSGHTIRYFHSTEYGSKKSRPHHHAILFNYQPGDLEIYKKTNFGTLYKSQELLDLWQDQGFVTVAEMSYKTAAYTAAYTIKKITGKNAQEYYLDHETGECLTPEKMTCSRAPAIGVEYFNQFKRDYLAIDSIRYDNKMFKIPRAYLRALEKTDPSSYDDLKIRREAAIKPLDRYVLYKRYEYLIENQKKYKKSLYGDEALRDDGYYLKSLNYMHNAFQKGIE